MSDSKKSKPYSDATIKEQRNFPLSKTIGIALLLFVQMLCIVFAIFYRPMPQDRIDYYEIIIEPKADGTLDLEYRFVWTPLDEDEDLTWVEIGMPNATYVFDHDSLSSNIRSCEKHADGNYYSARLYLDRPYKAGETLIFSFRVNQKKMLCWDTDGYFYELIPSWFNSTPVENYCFVWKGDLPTSTNANTQKDGYPAWEGSMPCGTYVNMQVQYGTEAFTDASTVHYKEFEDNGVKDSLRSEKAGMIVLAIFICIILLWIQIYMVDSVVSYHRGRGFLTGYGHHIHLYGRTNPQYRKEKKLHASRSGHSGGGCACACACACAGGGRAGCSQKDTHAFRLNLQKERAERKNTNSQFTEK